MIAPSCCLVAISFCIKLAEELRSLHPGLKIIFMSGHAAEMINSQGGSDPAPDLLSKPFLPAALVRKVRAVLDQ